MRPGPRRWSAVPVRPAGNSGRMSDTTEPTPSRASARTAPAAARVLVCLRDKHGSREPRSAPPPRRSARRDRSRRARRRASGRWPVRAVDPRQRALLRDLAPRREPVHQGRPARLARLPVWLFSSGPLDRSADDDIPMTPHVEEVLGGLPIRAPHVRRTAARRSRPRCGRAHRGIAPATTATSTRSARGRGRSRRAPASGGAPRPAGPRRCRPPLLRVLDGARLPDDRHLDLARVLPASPRSRLARCRARAASAARSSISSGRTMIRTSRPAWIGERLARRP